jgi:hypothetical protein
MTKKTKFEVYVLSGLLVVLAVSFYMMRSHQDVFTGVHAADDGKFEPLNVPDPSLRVDLLERIQKQEYAGQHRNIFSEEPLPPPPDVVKAQKDAAQQALNAPPPPPPPVTVPATFYGIVTDPATGKSQACFSANQDNIYIVPEGGTLLNQFRVTKIGNNTVELTEISSGRSTTLTLPQPTSQPNPNMPPQEAQDDFSRRPFMREPH